MIFRDAPVMIQNMFGVTPKSFNAINMVLHAATAHEAFWMIDRMMFAIPFQGLIAAESVRVVDWALPRLGLNMPHELVGTDGFDDFGVDTAFALQEPKHDAFTSCRSPSLPFAFAPKVGFVQFDLTFQFASFQFGQMEQRFSEALIDASDHFDIDAQVLRQPIGGLELIEALEDRNLSAQTTQTFAFPTQLAFHIPSAGVQDLKRATENTLPAPQKVGRTAKNRVSSRNHAPVLAHTGYETP